MVLEMILLIVPTAAHRQPAFKLTRLSFLGMSFQTVGDVRFVQVGDQRLLVRCYAPDTDDVVVLWPSALPRGTGAAEHLVAPTMAKQHRPGEYVPEDDPAGWPTSGPCVELPRP